jgi:CubicO group peptidase (beta-lactamase class C family)
MQPDPYPRGGGLPRSVSALLRPLLGLALAFGATRATANVSFPLAAPAAVGVSTDGLDKLSALLRASVDRGEHAGFISVLARDHRIADWQTWGVRDVASGAPMRSDTILRIYSMTKIVTSVAILQLVEAGKLSLDDRLADHLPAFASLQVMTGGTADAPQLTPAIRPVTLRHLLTHTGGFTCDFVGDDALTELYRRADLWQAPSLAEFVARAAKLPLRAQPGTAFHYSIGNDLLGAVIERVTETDFESYLRTHLFGPLGMRDTSFDVPEAKRARLASLSRREGGRLVPAEPVYGTYAEPGRGFDSGGAGLFSTAGDFLRFAQMLANGGELFGVRILKPETVTLMTRNHLAGLARVSHEFSPAHGWGLGVEVELEPGRDGFGWCGAATTYVRISPQERTVALLFAQHLPFNEHGIFAPFVDATRASLLPAVGPQPAPVEAATITVWHGDEHRIGHLGRAQPDFNLLGAVSHPDQLVALTWSLNGGPPQTLDVTPQRRIARRGDFNAEIPLASLPAGRHAVELAARWTGGLTATRAVTLEHRPGGRAPLPWRIRWQEVARLDDVGQATDGHWRITESGLRTVATGYDRVFLIGDASWRDYEVTGTVTFHDLAAVNGRNSGRVRHAGFCLRWQGNSPVPNLPPGQPKHGLHPRGGITWLTYRDGAPLPQREFYPGDSEKFRVYAPLALRLGERFRLKTRCVTKPDTADGAGVTEYSLKAWRDGDPEPAAWDYVERQVSATALRTGGVALVAHEADVTFGDLEITPL